MPGRNLSLLPAPPDYDSVYEDLLKKNPIPEQKESGNWFGYSEDELEEHLLYDNRKYKSKTFGGKGQQLPSRIFDIKKDPEDPEGEPIINSERTSVDIRTSGKISFDYIVRLFEKLFSTETANYLEKIYYKLSYIRKSERLDYILALLEEYFEDGSGDTSYGWVIDLALLMMETSSLNYPSLKKFCGFISSRNLEHVTDFSHLDMMISEIYEIADQILKDDTDPEEYYQIFKKILNLEVDEKYYYKLDTIRAVGILYDNRIYNAEALVYYMYYVEKEFPMAGLKSGEGEI